MHRITRFKICCIADEAEAALAVGHGASALGLVSEMPSGPGVIDEDRIAAIAALIPPGTASFLLTSRTDAAAIIAQQKRCRVDVIQLCDAVPEIAYTELRAALPGVKLVQVIHVTGPQAWDEARRVAPQVDALLLDSGNPDRAIKELGGTGRAHDWNLSRRIRAGVPVPVFLAGGLRPDNVAEAIGVVHPYGVDVCSGVRTEGRLDESKLRAFVTAVSAAG